MGKIRINWKAIPETMKMLGKIGKEHAPDILVGLGIIGFGVTCYFVGDAAVKAETAIDKEVRESDVDKNDIPLKEKIKITAPYYWKAGISGGLSVGCILAAHKVNLSRISSLGAMYALARNDLKEVKDKIIETDGQKKLDQINHEIANDVRKNTSYGYIYETGCGNTIFKDKYTGIVFKSSNSAVNDAITTLNTRLMVDGEYGLDDFLYNLHLPDVGCAKNAVFRANTATDIIHSYQILDYGPLSGVDPTPVCVINYEPFLCPTYDFDARTNRYE